jgi:hypothetical protein
VVESLKRKDAAAGETEKEGVSFRETVVKTINEY